METTTISIRVARETLRNIDAAARRAGKNRSDYMLSAVLDRMEQGLEGEQAENIVKAVRTLAMAVKELTMGAGP